MTQHDPALLERARRVRLLVLDVDGVLTDGRLHLTAHGEETKVFHVRDGSGLVAVQRAGIAVAIISGRDSPAVTRRAAELGIRHVRQGIADKRAVLDELLRELQVAADALALPIASTQMHAQIALTVMMRRFRILNSPHS